MAEREQKKKQAPTKSDEVVEEVPAKSEQGEKIKAELDDLLDEIDVAITDPPPETRAYFRGRCLQRWPHNIVAANWDSLVFDVGGDPLRRVPMMEPLRGTKAHVGSLIDECESAADLLQRLGQ